MAIRLSSQAAHALVTRWGLAALFAGGHVRIYEGAPPARADDPPQGQLLAVVTLQGKPEPTAADRSGGLTWQAAGRYGHVQDTGDWKARALQSGQPGWWRMVAFGHAADGSGSSNARMDGQVGDTLDLGGLAHLAQGQLVNVSFEAHLAPG